MARMMTRRNTVVRYKVPFQDEAPGRTFATLATALSSGCASRNCTKSGVSSSWSCAAARPRPRPRAVAGSAPPSAAPSASASSASGGGSIRILTLVVRTWHHREKAQRQALTLTTVSLDMKCIHVLGYAYLLTLPGRFICLTVSGNALWNVQRHQ